MAVSYPGGSSPRFDPGNTDRNARTTIVQGKPRGRVMIVGRRSAEPTSKRNADHSAARLQATFLGRAEACDANQTSGGSWSSCCAGLEGRRRTMSATYA